jgi:hypothetical protein
MSGAPSGDRIAFGVVTVFAIGLIRTGHLSQVSLRREAAGRKPTVPHVADKVHNVGGMCHVLTLLKKTSG